MNANELTKKLLSSCEGGSAAVRVVTKLVPVGNPADKILPPTYEGGEYAFEKRFVAGEEIDSVLLDSVQSQANRFEDALLKAFHKGQCDIPVVCVEIPGHGLITTLDAPHRISDAIFRDSLWDGVPFRSSEQGKRIIAARASNATAFFEYCPTALLFGTWDSQGGQGFMGARIARSIVSEIVGYHAIRGRRTSSRIDPLGIRSDAATIYRAEKGGWTLNESEAVKENGKPKLVGEKGKPSEINHGNVTPTITADDGSGGVTIKGGLQTTVLSFAQLRHLRFPKEGGNHSVERDVAGRAVLAALGLYAIALLREEGYQLRSRCQLIPEGDAVCEFLGRRSGDVEQLPLDIGTIREAFNSTRTHADSLGLSWRSGLINLQPKRELLELVKLSDQMTSVPSEA